MKILNIHFKNINSLEGENRIDFNQPPISDSGVFAITGANGSGKSSILDAITLGLYGETFRFDRPAGFVMTKNTAECFASVEFLLNDTSYQSSWFVQRAGADPLGEIGLPVMQLLRLHDGMVLADNQAQVCKQIAELTGMNFRNFTRSILLAQGDFAAFLNALDSERMDILEKIISSDIYADYRNQISKKADAAEQQLSAFKQQLASIQLLNPEQLTACQHDLSDFSERHQEQKQLYTRLGRQQSDINAVSTLQTQVATAQLQLQISNGQLDNVQRELDQIDASQDVLAFKDDIQNADEQLQAVENNKAALAGLADELGQLKSFIAGSDIAVNLEGQSSSEQIALIGELSVKTNQSRSNRQSEMALWQSLGVQITEKKAAIALVAEWLDARASEQVLMADFPEIGKLKKLREELAALAVKQKQLAAQTKKLTANLRNNHAALEQTQAKKIVLAQKLSTGQQELAVLLNGNTAETLNQLKLHQQERVDAFQQLFNLASAHKKLTKDKAGWLGFLKKQPQERPDIEQLADELEKLGDVIKREENIKLALEQSRVNEALIKKLTADRHHLTDGKPCPLCGALQHPYSKRPPVYSDSLKAVADQQLKIRNLMATNERLKQQLELARKNDTRNQAINQRVQQIQGQWLGLCNRLNSAVELDINDLGTMQALLVRETTQLKEIIALIDKCRKKQKHISKLMVLSEKNAQRIERLEARSGQFDSGVGGESEEYQDNVRALAIRQQEERELSEKVAAQLAVLGEQMPDKSKENVLFDRLNARRQEYQGHTVKNKMLGEELAVLEAKQLNCQAEIDRYDELIGLYEARLNKAEIISAHLAIIDKQKLIADKEQQLAQLQQQARAAQDVLQEKLSASRFQVLADVRQLLGLHGKQAVLAATKADLLGHMDSKNSELQTLNVQLAEHLQHVDNLLTPEQLAQQMKSAAEQMEIARLETERLEKILNAQALLQQQYTDLNDKLQKQQDIALACMAEKDLLDAEHGMAFRKRVQAQVIGKLLLQANALLEKISGRYYLRQQSGEQGLALEIEDTFQGNVRRLPKTLSGGETFVISLALALGLCELANNGKAVDSLFIDEGFGNLDGDTLYTVISTLENLPAHGKTVGVISHVDAVQKRFKSQLQVVKKANGLSELRKVS